MTTRDLDSLTVADHRSLVQKVARHLGYCADDTTDEERAEVAFSIIRDTMREEPDVKCPDCGGPTKTTFVDTGESHLYETLVPGGYECANPQACENLRLVKQAREAGWTGGCGRLVAGLADAVEELQRERKSPALQALDQAFYELTVKERDYERVRADRLQRELDNLKAGIREHHKPSPYDGLCTTCADEHVDRPGVPDEFLPWPCPTGALLSE